MEGNLLRQIYLGGYILTFWQRRTELHVSLSTTAHVAILCTLIFRGNGYNQHSRVLNRDYHYRLLRIEGDHHWTSYAWYFLTQSKFMNNKILILPFLPFGLSTDGMEMVQTSKTYYFTTCHQ